MTLDKIKLTRYWSRINKDQSSTYWGEQSRTNIRSIKLINQNFRKTHGLN